MGMVRIHLGTFARERKTLAVPCLVFVLLISACGSPTSVTGTTMLQPVPNTILASPPVYTAPEYQELGGWWLIPRSTLVVRGTLKGVEERHPTFDVWQLETQQVLLGESEIGQLRVVHFSAEDIESGSVPEQTPWNPGDEGIFFLTPYFQMSAIPDVYTPVLGSVGVLSHDLDYWSQQIPRAADVLGSRLIAGAMTTTEFLRAVNSHSVVDGTVQSVSAPREILGWEYVEVELASVTEIWSNSTADPPTQLLITLPADEQHTMPIGDSVRIAIAAVSAPEPLGDAWFAVGGAFGLFGIEQDPRELRTQMDSLVGGLDDYIQAHWEEAVRYLRALKQEKGRIPLSIDHLAPPQPVDLGPLFAEPLSIQTEDTTIVFTVWPFTLMDGSGRVSVLDSEGALLLEGAFEGEGSIMHFNDEQGRFEFRGPGGNLSAVLTDDQLLNAQMAAIEEYESAQRKQD